MKKLIILLVDDEADRLSPTVIESAMIMAMSKFPEATITVLDTNEVTGTADTKLYLRGLTPNRIYIDDPIEIFEGEEKKKRNGIPIRKGLRKF